MRIKKVESSLASVKTLDSLPIGTILPYSSTTIPTGWLVCDGSLVSRTTYAGLFSIIGTTFGEGDGSTTFALPNMKGKVFVGQDEDDTNFASVGNTGGEKTHTLTISEIPSHSHSVKWQYEGGTGAGNGTLMKNSSDTTNYSYTTVATGGGKAHNNLQPYLVGTYIIKAEKTVGVVGKITNAESTSTEDTYSCEYVNNCNTYSSDEVFTGKYWVDGKPIYRATSYESNATLAVDTSYYTPINITNLDTITSFSGILQSSGSAFILPSYRGSTDTYGIECWYEITNKRVLTLSHMARASIKLTYIIEYTKTTD